MFTPVRLAVSVVVQQHLEDTINLHMTRSVLTRAPHIKLHLLRRLDDRLAASLDGLTVAGDLGRGLCAAALATPSRGVVFAAAANAIERRDTAQIESLLAIAEAAPELCSGLTSAFAWASAPSLRGITKPLLDSPSLFQRDIGLAVCALHHVDPGAVLNTGITASASRLQAFATAGALGRVDLLPVCQAALADEDLSPQFEAARSSLLLGDRQQAVETLGALSQSPGPYQAAALMLALKVLGLEQAHALLKPLAQDAAMIRTLIRGIGAAGDPHYVPWLIKQMSDLKLTRLAGESFSLITGLDLAFVDLDCKPPEKLEFGPNDDPADADVAMDEDDSLPWPDPEKIAAWWAAHGARFKPGTRYFVGEPPSVAHCRSVLRGGFQRQRISAAEYLCLLAPGTPLFNTAAPAWRQERLLAQMEA